MSEYEGISREGLIDMLEEATDTLAALRAENAALKEALQAATELSAAAMRYAEGAMK